MKDFLYAMTTAVLGAAAGASIVGVCIFIVWGFVAAARRVYGG